MAKKSAGELKEEGTALNELIVQGRKKAMNFALVMGKEGCSLEAHPTKGADVMWRQAKAAAGGTRGAQGVMNVSGKVIELSCETEDFPGTLPKTFKRHLKERGLSFKVVMILPNGERLDDGDEDEEDTEVGGTDSGEAPVESGGEPESGPDPMAEVTRRLKELVPQVRSMATRGVPGADRLGKGLQAAAGEIKAGNLERAQMLVAAIAKSLSEMGGSGPEPSGTGNEGTTVPLVDLGELRRQLEEEFGGLGKKLEMLKDKASKEVAGKAGQLATMFRSLVDQDELKKAAGVLKLLGTTLTSELSKLAEMTGGKVDEPSGTNPEAMISEHGNLSVKERAALIDLSKANPAGFAAASDVLQVMDKDGVVDISPAARQKSLEDMEAARRQEVASRAALEQAKKDLEAFAGDVPVPGSEWESKHLAAEQANKAFRDFAAALPAPAEMTEKERQEAMIEGQRLDRLRKEAQAAAVKAKQDMEAAAKQKVVDATGDLEKSQQAAVDARRDLDARDAKRNLLDALTFGPLSQNGKPPMSDADKASFIEAFGKDGVMARQALDMAVTAPDPSVIARNVGMVTGKVADGFADATGKKMDLPPDQMRAMGMNALRMGSLQGDDYFKGFDDYLKSGKQHEPDPHGGLDAPLADPTAEEKRVAKVSLARSRDMAAAAINGDGKADFGSDTAKASMDHMMFHPGSLTTFTPHMNAKMAEVKGVFTDPATADDAQKVIEDTKVPASGVSGRHTAQKIIGATMGKERGKVTDADAKGAVLSAMMTPLSQGPVGSCFSTAPVRAIRETDPVKAMGEFSKIASTGRYTTPDGKHKYPANLTSPPGENALMRSWEYSVATAAGEKADGTMRTRFNEAIMPPNGGWGLRGIKDIVGAGEWNSTQDPVTGLSIPGVRRKIETGLKRKLKIEYDAGPPIAPGGGGGGDGVSTDGGYKIKYNGTAVTTEAAFMAAIRAIALEAAGVDAGSQEGIKIIALVDAPKFRADILTVYGGTDKAPWNLPSGGFEFDTGSVLFGGALNRQEVFGQNVGPPKESTSDRTVKVLKMMTDMQAPNAKGMKVVATSGDNANHAFNALPTNPKLADFSDPDADTKINDLLIQPGKDLAARKMPVEEARRMFEDHIRGMAAKAKGDATKAALVEALKRAPTVEMTYAEMKAKLKAEGDAYITEAAKALSDAYIAEHEPTADNARKTVILNFFKGLGVDALDGEIASSLPLPQIDLADTNWGDPTSQVYFVAAPNPVTGELVMWKKDKFKGTMTLAGSDWTDAKWQNVE